MIWEFYLLIPLVVVTSALISWGTTRIVHSKLYMLEVDVANLQEAHIRQMRKAASRSRWDGEDELQTKLEQAIQVPPAKPERWQKWGSSRNSKSEKSPEQ